MQNIEVKHHTHFEFWHTMEVSLLTRIILKSHHYKCTYPWCCIFVFNICHIFPCWYNSKLLTNWTLFKETYWTEPPSCLISLLLSANAKESSGLQRKMTYCCKLWNSNISVYPFSQHSEAWYHTCNVLLHHHSYLIFSPNPVELLLTVSQTCAVRNKARKSVAHPGSLC